MESFLSSIYFDNTVRHYLIVGAIILFAYLFKRFVARYFQNLIYFILKKVDSAVDKHAFSSLVLGPAEDFLFVFIAEAALFSLKFPSDFQLGIMNTNIKTITYGLGKAIVIFTFFRMLLRIIDYIALVLERRANLTPELSDNHLIVFFKDFLKVILAIIGVLTLLRFAFQYNITTLLAGFSIVGAAFALAARESIENLIASFVIFFDKPFAGGDVVKVQHITGTIERIGLRSTRIRTADKTYVTVPNKQMVDSIVDNLSLRTHRRAVLMLQLELTTPHEKVQSLLNALGDACNRPEITSHSVFLSDISPEAYVVNIEFLTADITLESFNMLRQDIILEMMQRLEAMEINVAGASKDVRIIKAG